MARSCDLCGSTASTQLLEKSSLWYLTCDECGHVFADISGFDFVGQNESANAELADTHDAKHYSAKHRKAYQRLLTEFAKFRQTNRLVEIGASSGAFLRQAEEEDWSAIGVEPVAESARQGIESHGLDIRIGTLQDAALETDSTDVIYSNAVLEHVVSPGDVFTEAARILRPGGLFYADTVNIESYTWRFLGAKWKLVDPTVHLHLFSPTTLSAYCERAGLEVLRLTTHGVRFHAGRDDLPTGVRYLANELRKAPYSAAARRNLKGDNIAVYARKR